MSLVFLFGTLALITFLYWAAYQSAKALKTKAVEINGNLLLSIPEFFFKLLLLGVCFGLANSLTVDNVDKIIKWPPHSARDNLPSDNLVVSLTNSVVVVNLLVGIVIGLVTVFAVNFASTLAIRIWGKKIYSPELIKSLVPRNQIEWLLIIVPLLLAVAVEEMLFRSLLIGGFSLVVNPWAMAIASSVLFGMMHAPQGLLGVVLTGLVGFVFAAVFILTASLLTVVIAHFTVNFLQILRAKEDIAWYERFEKGPDTGWARLHRQNTPDETSSVETTEPLT